MAGDPTEGDAFVFDLVDDAEGGSTAPAGAPRPAEDTADRPAAGSGRWRRRLAPLAAAFAIVLGTGYALDGMHEVERIDRIRGLHGGVVDVSAPLEELWEWEGDVGSSVFADVRGVAQVTTLGDLLVFVSDGDLLALESGTGAEAWRIPLRADPECGPTGYAGWEKTAAATVVCLHGAGEDRAALAVGPDGVASAPRVLDPEDTRRYGAARAGPDGTVLRAKRDGTEPAAYPGDAGDAACVPTGSCTGTVESGRDIVLRAEDAVTGAVRWTVTVPFVATPASACHLRQSRSWDGRPYVASDDALVDTEAFGAQIMTGLVQLRGCGTDAAIAPDGVLLRGTGEPGSSRVSALITGGYVASGFGSRTRTVFYSATGETLGSVAGDAYEAAVSDGPGVLLGGRTESRSVMRAYQPDGTLRWQAPLLSGRAIPAAEVGETLVIVAEDGTVHGLDAATGAERWVRDPHGDAADGPFSGVGLRQVFTDGRHVLLLMRDEVGSAVLVSLDVTSGELAWDGAMADVLSLRQNTPLLAVDGNLLAITPVGVRGLG